MYIENIFPYGTKPAVNPFVPRAATSLEANFITMLNSLQKIFKEDTPPSEELLPEEFSEELVHDIAMASYTGEALSVVVKEYAPKIFAYVRKQWNCESHVLAQDLTLPMLQIQANSIEMLDENGTVTGAAVPTNSNRYIIETVSQKDLHTFFGFVPMYVKYMLDNPESLMCRVVGIFRTTLSLLTRFYIIVYENPEYTSDSIPFIAKRMYSLQGIKVLQPVTPLFREPINNNRPKLFVDKNLDRTFCLGNQRDHLVDIMKKDVQFLRENQMIQYQLVILVGRLVIPEGEDIALKKLQEEKRGLVESAFGEWVMLGGISAIWKRYGKRAQVSSSWSYFTSKQEFSGVSDPPFYAERFCEMLDLILTK